MADPKTTDPIVPADPAPPPDPLKPALYSTEWWLAVAALVGGLVAAGYAATGRADGEHVAQVVKDAVIAVGGLVLAAVGVYAQIKGRNKVKAVAAAAQTKETP